MSQLADLVDVDREVLGRWIRGERTIKLSVALRVMQAMRIVLVPAEDLPPRLGRLHGSNE